MRNENEPSTCQYYKFILGSCRPKLTELSELFPGRLSHKYFRELHIISLTVTATGLKPTTT